MDSYRTEDEQVEALRRWWDENGRSTIVAVVVALAAGFGWQGWQAHQKGQAEAASDVYQQLLRTMTGEAAVEEREQMTLDLAEQLKQGHGGSTYAQFAALHLARIAVENGDLAEAEAQLRWVLGRADKNSDAAQLAQLRLARVVAAAGDSDKALAILAQGGDAYQASYAVARGDILLAAGNRQEALEAYGSARSLAGLSGVQLSALQAKLQSLMPLQSSAEGADAPAPTASAGDEAVQAMADDGGEPGSTGDE